MEKKLVKIMVNECWLHCFKDVGAEFSSLDFSNHCPGILQCHRPAKQKSSSFKISNFLTKHKDFRSNVMRSWSSSIFRTFMFQLCQKLKALEPLLKTLNWENFSNIYCRDIQVKDTLLQVQNAKLCN